MTQVLDDAEIAAALSTLPDWERLGDTIVVTYQMPTFPVALDLVRAVGAAAERANHHPDVDIRWRRVRFVLSTHDAGGITGKDIELARVIHGVAQRLAAGGGAPPGQAIADGPAAAVDGGPGPSVPRDRTDDYREEMAAVRRGFIRSVAGVDLPNVATYSLDPATLAGNVENFLGVAQVPIGLAGPLRIDGEHVQGDVYVPLATTEGTLVASYNRGMRLLSQAGGVRTTVVDDRMQRAPVFVFADARAARQFGAWLVDHHDEVAQAAAATTGVGRLIEIEQYAVGPLRYLRFDYTTGDAAGQNMTGRATDAACKWIVANHPDHPSYVLSGGIDTDKKHSHMNMLRTRGKRVVAEATLPADVLAQQMGVTPAQLFRARQYSQTGGMLAGTANNGAHAANALAALFIATGQDAANVAEAHSAIVYSQLLESGDYYWSITLPALIVATVGGGTGLATQRECLSILGCVGTGMALRFAEICAAVVLAGEVSLSSAVLAGDWVTSHEQLGRNRI